MDAQHSDLQAVFTYLRSAVVPAMSTEELASQISSAIKHSSHTSLPQSPDNTMSEDQEMTCMFLTLIGKIISKLSSKSLPPNVSEFFHDVIRRLFGVSNLTADLLHLINCQDRMTSHLAARCMADFVIYDIDTNIDSNSVWKITMAETFESSPPSCTLDTHLWALTDIIKRILKLDLVNKQEILIKLLADLESPLTSLYPKLLSQDSPEDTHSAENDRNSESGVSVCALLDLVEVLSAARLQQGLCSSVQRLVFLQAPALLHLTLSNTRGFVKKRALLLLKRILLHRAGEEWGLSANLLKKHDEEYDSDLLAMADATLQEVDVGWLRKFRVESQASFFGGSKANVPDGEMKDAVMLRAVSLILIKCLEIKTLHVSAQGAHHAVNIQSGLLELMMFLQQQGLKPETIKHLCSWILVVFADQDDDLIESAKLLLTVYLHQRSLSPLDPACKWGYNPHCHFTLLLQSLSFDHSVLLDFLISDETCFLEYCVLYLKHLRDHWQDFSSACCHIKNSETRTHTLTLQHVSKRSVKTEDHKEFQNKVAGCRPSLVNYECSDDSEDDDRSVANLQVERNAEEPEAEIDTSKAGEEAVSGSADRAGKLGTASSEGLKEKVMSCLSELRTVISRLHSRGLFPYNPSSLLKLLLAIETKGQLENPTPQPEINKMC